MSLEEEIELETEYLETTEGEIIDCIIIENLMSILERFGIDLNKRENDI